MNSVARKPKGVRYLNAIGSWALLTRGLAAIATTMLASSFVSAQTYPVKPVKIIVGYAPGGAVDAVARSVGQSLSTSLGQPFVVENKPGAGTNIAVVFRQGRRHFFAPYSV